MAILQDRELRDDRNNPLPESVQKALTSSAKALLSGKRADSEYAQGDYRKLKGLELTLFNLAWDKIKKRLRETSDTKSPAFGTNTAPTKEATVAKKDPVKETLEKKAEEKKGMSEETKAKLKEAKAAKQKEPKPEKVYKWNEKHGDVGKRVFTSAGVGVIRAVDVDGGVTKVQIEATEKEHILSTKSVNFKAVDTKYTEGYVVDKGVRTASGAYSISSGDDVAKALNGLTTENLSKVADIAGLSDRFAKWADRNNGMQRMNLGNVLRGALKKEGVSAEKADKAIKAAVLMPRPVIEKKTPAPKAEKAAETPAPKAEEKKPEPKKEKAAPKGKRDTSRAA